MHDARCNRIDCLTEREPRRCSCNAECALTGRCCLNFDDACHRNHFEHREKMVEMPSSYDFFVSRARSEIFSCQDFQMSDKITEYYVVNACVSEASGTWAMLCEGPVTYFEQLVPVVVDQILYHNKYCAWCSMGLEYTLEHGAPLSAHLDCDSLTEKEYLRSGFSSSISSYVEPVVDGRCQIFFEEEIFTDLRGYQCISRIIDHCDEDLRSRLKDYDMISAACRSYQSVIGFWINDTGAFYSNVHCAICNGVTNSTLLMDPECSAVIPKETFKETLVPTLSILLDLSGTYSIESSLLSKCDSSNFRLDYIQNKCIPVPCPSNVWSQPTCLPVPSLFIHDMQKSQVEIELHFVSSFIGVHALQGLRLNHTVFKDIMLRHATFLSDSDDFLLKQSDLVSITIISDLKETHPKDLINFFFLRQEQKFLSA